MLTSKLGRIFVGETERPLPVLKNDYQRICALRHKVGEIDPWGLFHQRSTRSFYVCKLRAQLFCAFILGLYFTGAKLLAQKLRIECW
jgi:hypothetical protein